MRVSADYNIRELVAAELLHRAHRAAVVYRVDVAVYAVVFSVLRELLYRAEMPLYVVDNNVAQVVLMLKLRIVFRVQLLPLFFEKRFGGVRDFADQFSVRHANCGYRQRKNDRYQR